MFIFSLFPWVRNLDLASLGNSGLASSKVVVQVLARAAVSSED